MGSVSASTNASLSEYGSVVSTSSSKPSSAQSSSTSATSHSIHEQSSTNSMSGWGSDHRLETSERPTTQDILSDLMDPIDTEYGDEHDIHSTLSFPYLDAPFTGMGTHSGGGEHGASTLQGNSDGTGSSTARGRPHPTLAGINIAAPKVITPLSLAAVEALNAPDPIATPLDVVLANLGCLTRTRSRSFSSLSYVHVPPTLPLLRELPLPLSELMNRSGKGGGIELQRREFGSDPSTPARRAFARVAAARQRLSDGGVSSSSHSAPAGDGVTRRAKSTDKVPKETSPPIER